MAKGKPFPKKMSAKPFGKGAATPNTGDPSGPAFKKGGMVPFKKKGKGKK